jgi:hypothetical protein
MQAAQTLFEIVIASEAKQSRMLNSVLARLLRRGACHRARISRDPLAPRNDETFVEP